MRRFYVVAVVALAVVPAAFAKSPPKAKYECTIGGILFADITITGATTYTRSGKKGTYAAGTKLLHWKDKTVPGYTIVFKTGPLKGYKGRWYASKGGVHEIALRNPIDGFESIYCDD